MAMGATLATAAAKQMTSDTPVCCICGRELKRAAYTCNYDNQNDEFIAPDAEPEHGEFGVQYVGMTCAISKGIPRKWLSFDGVNNPQRHNR